jgi:hypothetical protein
LLLRAGRGSQRTRQQWRERGTQKDRYYINITDCSTGDTLLFLDNDNDASTVDPTTITGGNLQIHASSCTQ